MQIKIGNMQCYIGYIIRHVLTNRHETSSRPLKYMRGSRLGLSDVG